MVTEDSEKHCSKALLPMVYTESGMVMEDILVL